jgi:hypothetical protein
VDISVSLVGTASYNYPINAIYLWTSGPQEAVLRPTWFHRFASVLWSQHFSAA